MPQVPRPLSPVLSLLAPTVKSLTLSAGLQVAVGQGGEGDPMAPRTPTTPLKVRDPTRTYQELLDVYSLHEFIIRRGATLSNTPEFASFQRSFADSWPAIQAIVRGLEALLTDFEIPLAYIDGKKVASLAVVTKKPTSDQLMDCIANRAEVTEMISDPYRSIRALKAIVKMQSVVRMFLQRVRYLRKRYRTVCCRIIQRSWRGYFQLGLTRAVLRARAAEALARWQKLQDYFVESWTALCASPRMAIHLPSLSYPDRVMRTTSHLDCRQNSQLARLFDLVDPTLHILYITPFPLGAEVLHYYFALLAAAGVADAPTRVHFMHPESSARLNVSMSLSNMVLCSDRLLRRIASYVQGRTAYFVFRDTSKEDFALAMKLALPIVGCEPSLRSTFSTKSGCQRIFEAADVVVPPGESDLYEESCIFHALANAISTYPEYPRWLLKINREVRGRGVAYFDVRSLRCLRGNSQPDYNDLLLELQQFFAQHVQFVGEAIYPTWEVYMLAVAEHGAVLEAVPCEVLGHIMANVFIHPGGEAELQSVQEQLLAVPYVVQALKFPQTLVPHLAVCNAALAVAQALRERRIFGYFSVDFVLHRKAGLPRLWAVDMEIGLTDGASIHNMFKFMCNAGTMDDTGQQPCIAYPGAQPQPRSYIFSGLIHHPYLYTVRHGPFFNLCRHRGISFDLQERVGVLFQLPDTLLRGVFGLLCIGCTLDAAAAHLWAALELVHHQLGESSILPFPREESNLGDVYALCKELNRGRPGVTLAFSTAPAKPQAPRRPIGLGTLPRISGVT
eukprot:GGOE01042466.1.p1 GENE.GGOE01042466.1~~GGOE01042466.1.p1  ORF type:complete len:905 (-),score=220.92 GGOE01042466.1:122-2485(-)